MKTSTFSTSGSTISAIVAGLTLAGSISAQPLTIDKELLSGIVQAKQEEIKARFMGDLVRKNIRTTNNTTYNTLYDLVDVLLTEKNSTRMTEAIVHKVADYGVTYMATWYFIAKEGPQTIVTAKDTIKLNGRPFDALTKLVKEQYEEQRKGTDHFAPGIRIDQDTPFLIGYVNWLMDEMYDSLKVKAGLKKRGLYLSDPERKWQKLHGPDYPGFWNAHDPSGSLRQSILLTLKAFCMKVDSGVVELGTIADSVGLYGNTDVWNMLDLRTLAAPKGKAGEASTESQPDQMVRSFWGNDVAIQDGASGNKRVELIFELFQHSVEIYRQEVGQNNLVCKLADIITKYVILDPEHLDTSNRFGFSVDVEAIILSFEDRIMASTNSPVRNNPLATVPVLRSRYSPFRYIGLNVRPYFTIGINYGFFSGLDSVFAAESGFDNIQQVSFAAEKIGLKWHWFDWKYTRGQAACEWYRYHGRYWKRNVRPREPFFNNMYVMVYGSGLLYTIADLRTEATFRYPIIGTGAGITFFNGMELNASYAAPVVANTTIREMIDGGFWNVAMDIPIFEYVRAARAKRAK